MLNHGIASQQPAGVTIRCPAKQRNDEQDALATLLGEHGLADAWEGPPANGKATPPGAHLKQARATEWTPNYDTTGLGRRMHLDTRGAISDLETEILVAMLASPVVFDYPSVAELKAAVRVRRNIVRAARATALDFHTTEADRPTDCWRYDEQAGFVVRHGYPLADALRKATQPEVSGTHYAFSCYRATEYVLLLALAEELAECNPALLAQLQCQCETRMIRSGQFHEVFLREYGSQETPLPARYYVPGDRLWFRNPDEHSADVCGFEGSWVFYHGNGRFSNFWQVGKSFSLRSKCLEIFHWRHGVSQNAAGDAMMDEDEVARRVAQSRRDPSEIRRILGQMMRWREPKGCYGQGGCIDTTREHPRWLCAGTSDLVLPMH